MTSTVIVFLIMNNIKKYRTIIVCFLIVLVSILCFPVMQSEGTVLLTDAELVQAKKNIQTEPLMSYFRNLSIGDGGQAAPVLYLLTGEKRFALKAQETVHNNLEFLRKNIPYMVNIWILRTPGPVVSALLAYDMTKDSGVYSQVEISEIQETLTWCITHFLNEGTDHIGKGFLYQTDYIPEDMEDWVIANMNIHRLLAVGLYAMVFPDEPRSDEIIRYTEDYFERILSLGSRSGGTFAENPRYMGGVLQELYMLAAALKNAGKRDFFQDERLIRMFGFFAESIPAPGMQGKYRPTMIAADDAHWWENQSEILSWAASRYYKTDPTRVGEWIWCWKNLGSLMTDKSLLFVNPDIEPVKPDYTSYLPGMGYVILRESFADPDETFFLGTFGPELGTSNRTMHHHPNHGDFSLIWRGYPVMLTRGCASYVWSRRMRDQTDFSHSVVTFDGAGESSVIPEKKYDLPALETNATFDETLVRDYYPDGITNYVSANSFDYVAGHVRNWGIGLPAPFNVRHFIHLKPDVFVIWDQVRSPYPLQWNMHLPAESVRQNGRSIEIVNHDGVEVMIDFLQDEPLDFTLDWPLESIRREWPMVLSCPYGKGMFIFNALDITRQVIENNHEGAIKILENLLSYPAQPKHIGLIETDGQTETVLNKLGFSCELLGYEDLDGDLSRFDRIIVGHFAVLVRDRDMLDYREKLWKYVENGGVCYWAYQFAWGWKPGDTSGPGYFPYTLMVGEGTSVLWGEGIELDRPLTMDNDSIWKGPNHINPEDWLGWQVGAPDTLKLLHYNQRPNTDRARNIPVYYSDYWNVHASALRTYNIDVPQTRSRFGPYRWIKVHHEPSDDYFAVLRLRKKGLPGAEQFAEILKGTENETIIHHDDSYWRILLGNHPGNTGNLTVLKYDKSQVESNSARSKNEIPDILKQNAILPREMLFADMKDIETGGLKFSFEHPATFLYDASTQAGRISMLDGGKVTLPWELENISISGSSIKCDHVGNSTMFGLPPGEFTLKMVGNKLILDREIFAVRVKVVDRNNQPVQWVHVFRDLPGDSRTQFQGATDAQGFLTMRWDGEEKQSITLSKGKQKIRNTVHPGEQIITF
ncbi:MAG: hypothetical protein JXB48_13345 [Candidatus Latescibacteria bacterium]|nr:hypothetical protein [Candidatus Latescibacterota bacterium]